MTHDEATALIRDAVSPTESWAELGAGTGTFTRALLELVGPDGTVYALDRDPDAVAALRILAPDDDDGPTLEVWTADFTGPLDLPVVDGVLMANALHFVRDQTAVLGRVVGRIQPGGRLLLVEYDQPRANPWVPYPVSVERLRSLARATGLGEPQVLARRASRYQREMYAAMVRRPD